MNKAISSLKASLVCLVLSLSAAKSHGFTTTNMSGLPRATSIGPGDLFLIDKTNAGAGTYSTKAITSDALLASIPNTNRVKNFGAIADKVKLTDVSVTSGSAIITSASANWTAADVGKTVVLDMGVYNGLLTGTVSSGSPTITSLTTNGLFIGMECGGFGVQTNVTITAFPSSSSATMSANATASGSGVHLGFTPTYIQTTIASVQSAGQCTLNNNATVTSTGCVMEYGTDNTTNIQSAINASASSGAVIKFEAGGYMLGGPLLNPAGQNSVLVLPTNSATIITIRFEGTGGAGRGQSGFNGKPSPETGTILFCATPGSGTYPAIVGGSGWGSITAVLFESIDMTYRTHKNPQLSAINVQNGGGLDMARNLVDTDYQKESDCTLPTRRTPAIIGPNDNSGGIFQIQNCEINNYGACVHAYYHAEIRACQLSTSRIGVNVVGNGVHLSGIHFVGNQRDIVNNSAINAYLGGEFCDFEDQSTSAFVCTKTIDEVGDRGGAPDFIGTMNAKASGEAYASVPVNFTSHRFRLTINNALASQDYKLTQQYNPVTILQHAYTDGAIQAISVNDTTGWQFNNSSGTAMAYVFAAEQFNQWVFQAASGVRPYFRNNNGNGLYIDVSTGVVTCDVGVSGPGSGLTSLNASSLASGTVPAAQMPAFTGDVTTSAGTVATTVTTPKGFWSGTTGNTAIAAGTTYFFPLNNSSATLPTTDASGGTRTPVMRTMTLQNFCAVQSTASLSGKNITYTVMTNGVATALTFAINGASALTGSDSTHTTTLIGTASTPIEVGIKIVSDASSGVPKIGWSLEWK